MKARRGETPPAARCAARQRGRHRRRRTKTHRLNHEYAESRRPSDTAFTKPAEAQSRLHESPSTRRTTKSHKLIGEQAQIRMYLFEAIRNAASQVSVRSIR